MPDGISVDNGRAFVDFDDTLAAGGAVDQAAAVIRRRKSILVGVNLVVVAEAVGAADS